MHFTDELLESSLTPEDKMDDWHNGKRKENISACGDAKLKLYYDICVKKGYATEVSKIVTEARSRGLSWAQSAQPQKSAARWDIITAKDLTEKDAKLVYDHKDNPVELVRAISAEVVQTTTTADVVHSTLVRTLLALALGLKDAADVLKGLILHLTKLDTEEVKDLMKAALLDEDVKKRLAEIKTAINNIDASKPVNLYEVNYEKKSNLPPFEYMNASIYIKAHSEEEAKEIAQKQHGITHINNAWIIPETKANESLEEDTVKIKDHKWTNKGAEGTHGTFTTKKAADAQRKAMFANGYHEELAEDVEKHDELNPKLFEDNKLKPEVREKIVSIVEEFVKNLRDDGIRFGLKDIILIGSNCSYNYTKDSDLDIHLIADSENLDCSKEVYDKLYGAYRSLFNKKLDIDFYGIPVEIYVELDGLPRVSNGVYSVMSDSWLKEPVKDDIPELDKEAFDKELKVWEDRYNEVISEKDLDESLTEDKESDTNRAREIIADQIRGEWDADRGYTKAAADLAELKDIDTKEAQEMMLDIASEEHVHVGELETAYSAFDSNLFDELEDGHNEAENNAEPAEDLEFPEPEEDVEEPIEIEDEEIEESLNEEIHNDQLDSINQFIDDIYALRKESLAKDGEYGIGNLVFKEIRNKGYLDNLKELKNKIIGDELSLK